MARAPYLLVWISVLNMCLSQNAPFPPYWGWGRQYETYNDWQATAAGYKYPVHAHQLQFAPFPLDTENQENVGPSPDCIRLNPRSSEVPYDSRMNERSISSSHSQIFPEEGRVYPTRVEEPRFRRPENGTSKILSSFLKPLRRRVQGDNNQITFPGPTAMPTKFNQFEPVIPDSCKSSTFCEDVMNFPQETIDRLIEQEGNRLRLQVDQITDSPDITQRLGPTEENVELCNFTEKVVYPQAVKGTDGKWYTLVNRKDNPVQGFRVEICDEDGSSCSDIIAAFQEKYSARCKQKYVLRTATAVITENGQPRIVEKPVKVPSCCSCVALHVM